MSLNIPKNFDSKITNIKSSNYNPLILPSTSKILKNKIQYQDVKPQICTQSQQSNIKSL